MESSPLANGPIESTAPGTLGTVLLVEDDTALSRVLARILTRAGYRVLTADGPPAVRAQLRDLHGAIDVVVSDLLLPGGGGWAVVEEVRAALPGVPVLFMSGYDLSTVLDRQLIPPEQAYRVELLQKPFTAGELTTRLAALTGEGKEGE